MMSGGRSRGRGRRGGGTGRSSSSGRTGGGRGGSPRAAASAPPAEGLKPPTSISSGPQAAVTPPPPLRVQMPRLHPRRRGNERDLALLREVFVEDDAVRTEVSSVASIALFVPTCSISFLKMTVVKAV